MKNRIFAFILLFAMLFALAPSASAANAALSYEIAYDAKQNYVTVTLYVDNAEGLQAADLHLAFDQEMYEPIDNFVKAELPDDAMCFSGIPPQESGVVTCSVIFTEECRKADLDSQGRLKLGTFSFLPRVKDYDMTAFCYFALSFDVNDMGMENLINVCGNPVYMEGKTAQVTAKTTKADADVAATTTKKSTSATNTPIKSNWYIYLIAGVLAVAAIAGIAMVAIKSGHHEDDEAPAENDGDKKEDNNNG